MQLLLRPSECNVYVHAHEDVVLIILHCTILLYFLCVHEDVVLVPVDAQQADEALVLRIRQHGAKHLQPARCAPVNK